jgi:phosphoribosylamine--glycine ligase
VAVLVRAGVARFVIEERLQGPEASVIAICDGRRAVALPAARDHKRLGDGDRGPNTGGMGAYAPLPDLGVEAVDEIIATVHVPLLDELARRGMPFRGFLYAGLILTANGPRLLECNARLGDPEAQVILPLLAGPIGPLLLAAARGGLDAGLERLPSMPGAAVGIVLAAGGYPDAPVPGAHIGGISDAERAGALVFHAGTRRPTGDADGDAYLVAGGRVLTVVGRGPDHVAARAIAEDAAEKITWTGLQRRRDIAASLPARPVVGAAR